jgi:class 3 adenylate cyclase/predicted ATPase
MDLFAVVDQVMALLRQRGRVTYRALKVQFHLDDEQVDALKGELLYAYQGAVGEDGPGLVWTDGASATPAPTLKPEQPVDMGERPEEPLARRESPSAAQRAPDAERRQLTVLFCDLMDSTALARQLDPEEWREVVRAYQATCAEVIERFEGYIAQYLGDGLLVYLGYPQAHEDDPQRAVRAGLGMVEAIGKLNAQLQQDAGIRLAVRVGIHTGLVVVGAVGGSGRQEPLALGDTPNIAARLQGLAEPDAVVISAATHRLVQGYFACHDRGLHALKGVTAPVTVYRVLGDSGVQSRLELASPRGLTPFVGREPELTLLMERWGQVHEGRGQGVVVTGEAGIGKSRLLETFAAQLGRDTYTRLTFRGSPYAQQSALYPVIEHLQRSLPWPPTETPDADIGALVQVVRAHGWPLAEAVPLLAALLSVPLPEGRYCPLGWTPQRQKEETFALLIRWLLREAERQPVLAVWEDLHWADPSTLELLSRLLDYVPSARILTVLTGRPEFRPPWAPRPHLAQLTLNRLTRPQVEVMLRQLTGGKPLPPEVVQQIVTKTDGVPLFVEELTKMVLEAGWLREREDHYELVGAAPRLAIPATLHDSLMARLDRLATAKEVAQLGATVGREFSYEVLRAVAPMDEARLQRVLAQLVEAELLYQQGIPPQATYRFKHALIQEAAYQSLLKSTRQRTHQRIAQVLETQFPQTVEAQPELLAHHYTEAGLSQQAVVYWRRAGTRAIQASAHAEAIARLTKGLELLETLPDAAERTEQELMLLTALGVPLILTKGHAAPAVETTYARARELCRWVGETPQLFSTLLGLWRFYFTRGQFQTAHELEEQLLSIAESLQDPVLLLRAYHTLGEGLLHRGEFAQARARAEQGIALYDPQQHGSYLFSYGNDSGVACRCCAALALWVLGYPDQALERSRAALMLAQERAHPFSLTFALYEAALLHQFRRERPVTLELAERAMRVSTEQGFASWLAPGTIVQGWALSQQGQGEEGIAQMRHGLAAYLATGAELGRPRQLAMLAEAYGRVGQTVEGLAILAEALTAVHKTGGHSYEAELYRLKGELLLQQPAGNGDEAETCFRQALDVAYRQQAKSWELRAALSLSRLWQRQGKRAEAHALLMPIYNWFTEGFDTVDLQEATALIEELS